MYQIKLLESAYLERQDLPRNVCQQIKNVIASLAENPRPLESTELQLSLKHLSWQPRKIRLRSWRILYAVDDRLQQVVILAIRSGSQEESPHSSSLLAGIAYHYC